MNAIDKKKENSATVISFGRFIIRGIDNTVNAVKRKRTAAKARRGAAITSDAFVAGLNMINFRRTLKLSRDGQRMKSGVRLEDNGTTNGGTGRRWIKRLDGLCLHRLFHALLDIAIWYSSFVRPGTLRSNSLRSSRDSASGMVRIDSM